MTEREKIEEIKKRYPVGTRVMLGHMDDPYSPVPDNTTGTVIYVDDMGQIGVEWDNGRTLALVPEIDKFIVIRGNTATLNKKHEIER